MVLSFPTLRFQKMSVSCYLKKIKSNMNSYLLSDKQSHHHIKSLFSHIYLHRISFVQSLSLSVEIITTTNLFHIFVSYSSLSLLIHSLRNLNIHNLFLIFGVFSISKISKIKYRSNFNFMTQMSTIEEISHFLLINF